MANNFISNYRGAKSKAAAQEAIKNMPITRGDMQKNRLNNVAISTTPQILGIQVEGNPGFIDKISPEMAQEKYEQTIDNMRNAEQSTLYVNQDKPTANVNVDDRFKWFLNEDIYNNYDNLNKVIDAYDAAGNSRESKRQALSDWARKIGGDSEDVNYWFALFDYWNDMAYDVGDSPNMVSNMMRRIINNTRNNLYRKV